MGLLLLLEDAAAEWAASNAGCGAVACGLATFGPWRKESAGHAFHAMARHKLGLAGAEDESGSDEDSSGSAEKDEDAKMRAAWEARNAGRAAKTDEEEDLYEVLGIGHLGFSASAAQIKKGYQKAILTHHPDKLDAVERKKAEQQQLDGKEEPMFLKVQRAYDTLSNKVKRRGYDSQFAFDDSIPTGAPVEDATFFSVYGACFERNARFSVKKPVPPLGDNDTPEERVRAFYAFWTRFESWRDFSKFNEFHDGDLEQASSRMERRWMDRQNEIQQKKRKKKEYERVQLLVERAMERDPRLARFKAEEQRAREAALEEKRAKKEAEEKAKAEKERLEREKAEKEQAEKEARDKAAREANHVAKKAFKKQIRMLKKLVDDEDLLLGIETLSIHHKSADAIRPLVEAFDTEDKATAEDMLRDAISTVRGEKANAAERRKAEAERVQQEAAERAKREAVPWSADELSFLAKGVRKFPPGARNRWGMIANYVNTCPESQDRSADDCIAQSKLVAQDSEQRRAMGTSQAAFEAHQKKLGGKSAPGADATPPDAPGDGEWSPEQQQQLEEALKTYPASMDKNERWKSIAKAVEGKNKKECVARFKELRQRVLEKKR